MKRNQTTENKPNFPLFLGLASILCLSMAIAFPISGPGTHVKQQFNQQAKLAVAKKLKNKKLEKTSIAAHLKDPNLTSVKKRALELWLSDNSEQRLPKVLIKASMHGNERGTEAFVRKLLDRYKKGKGTLSKLQGKVSFDFLPNSNPDGSKQLSRYNARGVNLNRNFSVLWGITKENPGTKPFSEPETLAIKKLMEQEKYFAAIDVHGFIDWLVSPSMEGARRTKSVKTKAQLSLLSNTLAKKSVLLKPRYKVLSAASLGDGGAFEDWAFWEAGSYAFCLELSESSHFNTRSFHPVKKTYRSSLREVIAYERFISETIRSLLEHHSR